MMQESILFAKKTLAPGLGCLITTISTFIDNILFTVSAKVSPLLIEEEDDEKFTISALSLFCANSKDIFVLVLFSKNKLAIVMSLKLGTFFIFLFITSLKFLAVSKIK